MSDERPPEGDDETRPMESAGSASDETVAETQPAGAGDATRIQPSGGPRSDDDDKTIWTGRAEVRPPRPGTEVYETDWADPGQSEPQGRWWAPIAVGSAALVLLGLLGYGIAVIVQNSGGEAETPATTPVTATTTTADRTSAAAATDPTTSVNSPSPTLSTTEPTTEPASTEVTVPALRGMPAADAQAALERSGLTYRVIQRQSDAEPGTVIDSDPPEGSLVPSDSRITLVVAAGQSPSPAAATTAPAGEPAED